MNDRITHRVVADGADPLILSGVNDANLVALERATGVRASLRGDHVTLAGGLEAVERASRIAGWMIDVARMHGALTPDDVLRYAANGAAGEGAAVEGNAKIVLPGVRRPVRPKTAGQSEYVKLMRENEIVVGIGPAGTGKTYLAVAMAVEALVRKTVRKVVLARPAVEAGERLGFLPGDMQAKVDPYLRPLYDALEEMMPNDRVQRAIETRALEIAPLAYMRGRTLADAFVILDEAQNVTSGQMKMFLTRLGVNSRAVVIGDKTQIDLAPREESGLIHIERILPGIDGVAFCYLGDEDVVRHRLVREIIRAYEEDKGE
jgi:phosphate starvation-inducible protein PhoH and related proteins